MRRGRSCRLHNGHRPNSNEARTGLVAPCSTTASTRTRKRAHATTASLRRRRSIQTSPNPRCALDVTAPPARVTSQPKPARTRLARHRQDGLRPQGTWHLPAPRTVVGSPGHTKPERLVHDPQHHEGTAGVRTRNLRLGGERSSRARQYPTRGQTSPSARAHSTHRPPRWPTRRLTGARLRKSLPTDARTEHCDTHTETQSPLRERPPPSPRP